MKCELQIQALVPGFQLSVQIAANNPRLFSIILETVEALF